MWRPFSANHLRHSFCCYCTETTRLFVFLQKKKREAVGTWLVIFSLYVRLQTVGESLQALKSIFILQLSLKRVIVQIKWNYMKHHLYTISYSTLLLWQVFLCLKSINHFMILFSLKLYESSRKKFTWNRNKWQWFKFWTVASRCGRYKLFLYSYPCVLLCTSAAEKNLSDWCQCSTFQRSGSASWRCARKSSFSRPYGVCFSSPPPHLPSFIPTSRAATWQIFKYIFLHKKQEKSKTIRLSVNNKEEYYFASQHLSLDGKII